MPNTPNVGLPYPEDEDWLNQGAYAIEQLALAADEQLSKFYGNGHIIGGAATGAWADVPWGVNFGGDPFGVVGDSIVYNGPTRMCLITLQVQVGGVGAALTSRAGLGTAPGAYDFTSYQSTGPGASGTAEHAHHVSMLTLMGPDNVTSLVAGVAATPDAAYDARIQIVAL